MKRLVAAVAVFLATAGGACAVDAEARANVMQHIAQAMAAQEICDRLEAQKGMITFLGVSYGIDFKVDGDELLRLTREQMRSMEGRSKDAACVAGLVLYGPDGQNVPGLLREK